MRKLRILSILGIILLTVFTIAISLNTVTAYSHSFFQLSSDNIVYNSDVKGENRGFSLRRSTEAPRNTCGYYDWSANPKICDPYYLRNNPRISDRLALEAFKTFQLDSQAQNRLEFEQERNRRFFSFGFRPRYYGGFGGYSSGYYGSGYYPRSYGSYGSYGSYRYGF